METERQKEVIVRFVGAEDVIQHIVPLKEKRAPILSMYRSNANCEFTNNYYIIRFGYFNIKEYINLVIFIQCMYDDCTYSSVPVIA